MSGTIPFFGVGRELSAHRGAIMARIERTMATGQLLQGPEVRELETRVAGLAGRRHGVAVGSCTDGLFFTLIAAGIEPGDEVLVTDFSFVASASCIVRSGATPRFVDVAASGHLDLEKAARLVTSRTRALVVVHLYGAMMDPAAVTAFASDHDLILVEDAAQAIGATYGNLPAGSLGLASCFSFDPTKPVNAIGSGGLVVTDDDVVADRIRMLRYHGKDGAGRFTQLGYNSQMATPAAAVLELKLDLHPNWVARRRNIAKRYEERLCQTSLELPDVDAHPGHVFHKFVVQTRHRDRLRSLLQEAGITTMIHYRQPLHREPCFSSFDQSEADFSTSEQLSASVLSLPIHAFLTDDEVDLVAESTLRALEAVEP